MSKFSDQEKAAIFRESRRLLKDDGRPVPPVAREPLPEIVFEDPLERYKREADAADAERAAELRRQERASERITRKQANDLALEARVAELEARVDALEQAVSGFNGVADGAVQFSNAAVERLNELAGLANKVDGTLTTMRAVHRREVDALRDRLAGSEAVHARETAMLVKELNDARREIDRRADIREHARNRMAVMDLDEKVENVVALVREDIRERHR
jgi:multidrug efflux pump subunit AcrA (membrane-fusion protein)